MYLSVDKEKILNSKKNVDKMDSLTESYNFLLNNPTPVNTVQFMSEYKNSGKTSILENLNKLCTINSDITFSYLNDVLPHAEFSEKKLTELKDWIKSQIDCCDDDNHICRLESTISNIDSIIESDNNIENIHDDIIMAMNVDRIRNSCVYESYLENDMEVLVYNINNTPEAISDYELIIRKIKASNTSEYFASYPMLIIKNTELIRNLRITVSGDVLDLLTCLPTVIADKLSKGNLSNTVIRSYEKIFDKQIALMYTDLKKNESGQYQIYSTYLKRLTDAKIQLRNYNKALKESFSELYVTEGLISDGIKDFKHLRERVKVLGNEDVRYTGNYEKLRPLLLKMADDADTVERLTYLRKDATVAIDQLTKLAKNLDDVKNGTPSKYVNLNYANKALEMGNSSKKCLAHVAWIKSTYIPHIDKCKKELQKSLKESFITPNNNDKECAEEFGPDLYLYDEGVIEDVIAELEDSLADIVFNPDEEINLESFEKFTRLYRTYEAMSKPKRTMIKTGHKIGDANRKMVTKARTAAVNTKRATLPIKKSLEPITNLLTNTINKFKEMDKKERTDRIISGGRVSLATLIRRAIMALAIGAGAVGGGKVIGKVAAGAVKFTAGHLGGVIIAAIGILVATALDKKADEKQRKLILTDLKNELALVEEKIEDAKSDGARKEKYQLMRIQQKLKKDIERIEYHLD